MRILWVVLLTGILVTEVSAVTITTRTTALGANSYRETFSIDGFSFGFGQSIEIRYPVSLFGSLIPAPKLASDWTLLPTHNPADEERIFFAQALVEKPQSLAFSVDLTFLGVGKPTGVHPFRILDYPTGNVISSGFTVDADLVSLSEVHPNQRFTGQQIHPAASSIGLALNAANPAPIDVNVNISPLVNSDLTTYTGGGSYPQHGGTLMVAGIPLMLATMGANSHTAVIQSSLTFGLAQAFSIPVGLFGVTSAYTLINSAGGTCGAAIGELDFIGLSNSFTYTLREGTNVRDHFSGAFCNTVSTIAGTASFGADRLDMQQINLPEGFATDTLQRIDFISFGQGFNNGAPFLGAVTLIQPVPAILLPSDVVVEPGQSAAFPVAISTPAGTDGVFVTLVSNDITKISLGPPNSASTTFFIPPGATSSARSLYVYGGNFGTASITGSAMGYAASTENVRVTATARFVPSAITIFGQATQKRISVVLSSAPSSDLTLTLSSDNAGIAMVLADITIPAGALTAVVPVTTVAFGSAKIHATAIPFISDTAVQVTVVPSLLVTTTSLANGKLGVPYSVALTASGGTPPYTWGLASGALPTGLRLDAGTGLITGTPTAPDSTLPVLFTVIDSSTPPQTSQISLTLTIM